MTTLCATTTATPTMDARLRNVLRLTIQRNDLAILRKRFGTGRDGVNPDQIKTVEEELANSIDLLPRELRQEFGGDRVA